MQWFKHDSDATTDAKIRKLILRYNAIGYAVYFHCIELIVSDISESNITFELEHDSEIIADNLKIQGTQDQSGVQIVEEIMRYLIEAGLFEEKNGHITCYKILKRLDSSMTSNMKMRGIITEAHNNHDIIMMSHDGIMTESGIIMQEEMRREENRGDKKEDAPAKAVTPRFSKPSLQEIIEYCQERKNAVSPERFLDYYESNGWMVGRNKMKDWHAAVRTWEKSRFPEASTSTLDVSRYDGWEKRHENH